MSVERTGQVGSGIRVTSDLTRLPDLRPQPQGTPVDNTRVHMPIRDIMPELRGSSELAAVAGATSFPDLSGVAAAKDRPATPENVAAFIREQNPSLPRATVTQIAETIIAEATAVGMDPWLLTAQINKESTFNPRAVSHAGARGLGQLMPATARSLGVRNSVDIRQNLHGTARYMKQLYDRFGSWERALMAYNIGPGNMARGRAQAAGRAYVAAIMPVAQRLRASG